MDTTSNDKIDTLSFDLYSSSLMDNKTRGERALIEPTKNTKNTNHNVKSKTVKAIIAALDGIHW